LERRLLAARLTKCGPTAYFVRHALTRPQHVAINEVLIGPTKQQR
jgi:NADP-dependent 3-hydroxy acid dehydrogenase YdfG